MASEPVRIAVIGSGLAGLATAYSLHTLQATHPDGAPLQLHVALFEKSHALGMDSTSISVEFAGDTTPFRIDSPMRSINGGSHSRVVQLYEHLDVALRRADFSYSFARLSRHDHGANTATDPPPPYAIEDKKTANGIVAPPLACTKAKRQRHRTQFLYEGSNGLKFPPLALPSHIARGSITTRIAYLLDLAVFALSYLYLLVLAFAYSWLGLISRTSPRSRIKKWLPLDRLAAESVDEFCERYWLGDRMKNEVLVPLYAAVSTVGRQQAQEMPIAEWLGEHLHKDHATTCEGLLSDSKPCFTVDYIVSTFGSSHYVAEAGVQQVARKLVAPIPLDQVHLSSTITSITTSPTTSLHQFTLSDGSAPRPFHHVIFATQANQAAALLPTSLALAPILSALRSIKYVRTLVVNHNDTSILPQLEQDHRDLNLVSYDAPRSVSDLKADLTDIGTSNRLGKGSIQATHIVSRTHPRLSDSSLGRELYQTTNPIVEIDESKILSKVWYERAVVTRESKKVLPRFLLDPTAKSGETYQGRENIWFVGSWCAEGIPLLEGCLTSSERVVKELVRGLGVEEEVRLKW